jgi:alpha,alpha-trehalase
MDYAPVLAYIADYWPSIVRRNPREQGTLIGLPRPYLVPSAAGFFQEMYYWDSYFMALGVVDTPHEDVILDMVENLIFLYRRFGVIPNASRYYFLSRSQPPFLTRLIWLGYEVKTRRGDADAARYLARAMRVAEAEHASVWLATEHPHARQVAHGLSRYFDINHLDILASCESGWDHSTRCDDRWLEHLPVDLNAILYVREQDFARAAEALGRPRRAARWRDLAATRADTMRRLMWDEAEGFYFDYDFAHEARNPHASLAGFYTLWAGIATPAEAARMVARWLPRFEQPGGLVTTLVERAGRQWAWPNGWAPLQWLAVQGLLGYGYRAEAERVMREWCDNCAAVFAATGGLWEKYNVVDVGVQPESGLYGTVPGFGWSNAVFVDFARLLAAPPAVAVAPAAPSGADRSSVKP